MGTYSNKTMVVAVTVLKSLEIVCDYAFSLLERSGKNQLIFILLVHEEDSELPDQSDEEEKLMEIVNKGKTADIDIKYRIVKGRFPEKVAECLYHLDCPLLIVGEGEDKEKRLRELKEIETILVGSKAWHHRKWHHFLVVSERRKNPVLVVYHNKHRKKGSKEK